MFSRYNFLGERVHALFAFISSYSAEQYPTTQYMPGEEGVQIMGEVLKEQLPGLSSKLWTMATLFLP